MEIQVTRQLRPCIVDGSSRALLHDVSQGLATVEFEDGTFVLVRAERVRMLDSAELFGEYAWEVRQ